MSIQNKTILITGGFGFIAVNLALRLAEWNRIILFDVERRNALKYSGLAQRPHVTLVRGDVTDPGQLAPYLGQVDILIHCAAITGASTYAAEPLLTLNTNILGTLNALQAAKTCGVEKFINFSSSEVYGKDAVDVSEFSPSVIEHVKDLRWSYAISKLTAEAYAQAYFHEHQLPVLTVRPCNIYGPYQVGEGAIHNMVMAALRGQPLTLHGDGAQTRAWCYIDDFVAILLSLIESDFVGETFNIGNYAEYYDIRTLASRIVALTGSASPIRSHPIDYADVLYRRPQMTRVNKLLGYTPQFDLDRGLTSTIAWYRENMGAL